MDQPTNQDVTTCPECGAAWAHGMTCWEQLGGVIGWESEDPELLAQHFLTVACYNLQHPAQFTDESIAWLRTSLIERLDRGTAVEELRRRASRVYEGSKRVLRPESERKPVLRSWRMTISDVYIPDQSQGAAARVRAWAAGIRDEL